MHLNTLFRGGMVKFDFKGVQSESVKAESCSEETVMFSNTVVYVADEGVGDMAEVTSNLVQPSCLRLCLDE